MAKAASLSGDALKAALLRQAAAEGFDTARITSPDAIPQAPAQLQRFLRQGFHGTMGWMEDRAAERATPAALWGEVRSILMLGVNYGPATDPRLEGQDRGTGVISVYARGDDYHDVIKKKLKSLGRWLGEVSGQPLKVFVDTAPVMEKPLAEAAGLGWQGKHTNLVSRDFGSWLFLGAIYSAADMPSDEPERDHCGSCRACLDACPTAAFTAPGQIDARRCISYLTIEHKGVIDEAFRVAIGNRLYGCDDCLAVCPWNKFAQEGREHRLAARAELISPRLADLARLDDAAFRQLFARTPVKRIGRDRFIRNVLIAIGNSGDPSLAEVALPLLDDAAPLVRGMAVWALSRLAPQRLRTLAGRFAGETDDEVCAEWRRAGLH